MKYKMLIGFESDLSAVAQGSTYPIVPPRIGELVFIGEYCYEVVKIMWQFIPEKKLTIINVVVDK